MCFLCGTNLIFIQNCEEIQFLKGFDGGDIEERKYQPKGNVIFPAGMYKNYGKCYI